MDINDGNPLVILNFKTYLESTGQNALNLAKACENAYNETGVNMVVVPQNVDIYRISQEVEIPVFAQNIDPILPGGHTGGSLIHSLKESGASGTLINHSEHRMQLADISKVVTLCKDNNLSSVVCTNDVLTSGAAAVLSPDFIAVEPPELIGTGIPVSKTDPEVVTGTVDLVNNKNKEVSVLCGAGISTSDDMKSALDLGSKGVLLASGIILSKDPEKALIDLVSKI